MVTIPVQVNAKENIRKLDNWTRASAFMEDIQSQVWVEFCCRWFGLADYTTLYHEVEAFFNSIMIAANGLRQYNREGLIIPMIDCAPGALQEGMIFDNNWRYVEDIYVQPDLYKWREWRENAIKHPNQQY